MDFAPEQCREGTGLVSLVPVALARQKPDRALTHRPQGRSMCYNGNAPEKWWNTSRGLTTHLD